MIDLEFGQGGYGGRMQLCLDLLRVVLRGERLHRGVLVELRGREGGRSSLGKARGESVCQFIPINGQDATYI
jgi:hypothetical protein